MFLKSGLFALALCLGASQALALDDEADVCLGDGGGNPCLVTGNGRGYAAVSSKDGSVRSFLAHPCSMEKPDPADPNGDGIYTNNYISRASWTAGGAEAGGKSTYSAQSQVIANDSSSLRQQFFMPFNLKRNALIATSQPAARGVQPCLKIDWDHDIKSQETKTFSGSEVQVYHFADVKEPLVAVPLSKDAKSDKACPFSGTGWALMSVNNDSEIQGAVDDLKKWQKGDAPKTLASREVRELDTWRGGPAVCFSSQAQRKVYRQSETVLRMAQIQEPNDATHRANGMINASLPTGEFVVPFVRDMAYASVGLTQSNHQPEARQAVTAYFNAGPIGLNQKATHGPYQISTARYFCNGQEDADFSGQPRRNLELDSWGLALWATGSYFNKYHDTSFLKSQTSSGPLYQSARDKVLLPLLKNLDSFKGGLIVAKDSSAWEQNDEPYRHYAYSTITAIGGLKQFLPMAEAMGDTATVNLVKAKLALLQKGFAAAYIQNGHIRGTLESSPKNDMDGAVLEAINMGVVTDPKIIANTLDRMSILRSHSGGYLRVRNPGGKDEYEKHEFLFINFALARAYLKAGRTKEADEVIKRMQDKAAETHGLIPEMYVSQKSETYPGEVGSPAGAVPMVGYGAGVYSMYLTEKQASQGVQTASLDSDAPVSNDHPFCPPIPGDGPGGGRADSTK